LWDSLRPDLSRALIQSKRAVAQKKLRVPEISGRSDARFFARYAVAGLSPLPVLSDQ
jgi:hypothetical protein